MSRIRAGNTLVSQYVPPFIVSENVANGWELRWNENLKAFEAYNPAAEVKTDAGFESIEVYSEVATGTKSTFVLPWTVETEQSLFITDNGVKQQTDAYTISVVGTNSTNVTFSSPPNIGNTIEFIGLQASTPTDIALFTAVGTGTQDTWFLPWVAPSAASLLITVDGIKQQVTSYSITIIGSTTELVFISPPGLGDEIEVVGILDTGEVPASPVNGTNLGSGPVFGLFKDRTVAGDLQVLNFKSLAAGSNITITENGGQEFYTITADIPGFQNLGTGQSVVVNPASDPIQLRAIAGDGDQITTSVGGGGEIVVSFGGDADTLDGIDGSSFATTLEIVGAATGQNLVQKGTAASDSTLRLKGIAAGTGITVTDSGNDLFVAFNEPLGYASFATSSYNVTLTDRTVGVRNTASAVTVTLPDPTTLPAGRTITVVDETGTANATESITVSSAGGASISGSPSYTIDAGYGYVKVVNNGTNYFVISSGP